VEGRFDVWRALGVDGCGGNPKWRRNWKAKAEGVALVRRKTESQASERRKMRWNCSIKTLRGDTGLSKNEATDLWNRYVLSGYRSWKPWSVALIGISVYVLLLLKGGDGGILLRFLRMFSIFTGFWGSFYVAGFLAYPRMVEEGRSIVARKIEDPDHTELRCFECGTLIPTDLDVCPRCGWTWK
jgi:hypothetical protein